MNQVDLHVHSTRSDGTLTPTKLVNYAIEKKLSAFALTDHDNILSHKIATDYVKEIGANLEIIQGVEINTIYNSGVANLKSIVDERREEIYRRNDETNGEERERIRRNNTSMWIL